MKSQSGCERPTILLEKLELGEMFELTPEQCYEIACWVEDIEDELIDRRGWKSIHDDPKDYQDKDGDWIPACKPPESK
jgi:hypothetical protein